MSQLRLRNGQGLSSPNLQLRRNNVPEDNGGTKNGASVLRHIEFHLFFCIFIDAAFPLRIRLVLANLNIYTCSYQVFSLALISSTEEMKN